MPNGWGVDEIERLVQKTGASRERVDRFCRAVDKRLYLLLDDRQRRATLHFHLGARSEPADSDEAATGSLRPA